MIKSVLPYFHNALRLLAAHYYLALIPFAVSLIASVVNLLSHGRLNHLCVLLQASLLVIMPVIYGRLNEIATHKTFISWQYLFNRYFLKFLGILIIIFFIMSVPAFLLTFIITLSDGQVFKTLDTFAIFLSYHLLGLYAVPLLFFEDSVKQAIILGIKCLIGNLAFNLPLILMTICVSAIRMPIHFRGSIKVEVLFAFIQYGVAFAGSLLLFVVVTGVLEDKIYRPRVV